MAQFKVCVLINPESSDPDVTAQHAKDTLYSINEDKSHFEYFTLSPEINMPTFVEFISEHDKAETIEAVITPKGEWINSTKDNAWETTLGDILADNNQALVFIADCSK